LIQTGFFKPRDRVVLFNTGSGLKYIDVISEALGIKATVELPKSRQMGGIIQPY
jgi:threonine synthase